MESKVLKLRVLTAALRLKFKCRLRVESTDGSTTREVTSPTGIFTFDEQLLIHPTGSNVELSLMLVSEKGSQYNGGCVRATLEQLRQSVGQSLRLAVSRCIDKDAWVEVAVVKVPDARQSSQKELSFTQQCQEDALFTPERHPFTPERAKKANLVLESNLAETRSEHGFPQQTSALNFLQERRRNHDTARPAFGEFSNVRMPKREGKRVSPFESSPRRNSPEGARQEAGRSREGAREEVSAGKLRRLQQRFKHEQENVRTERERRQKVESSEQNYKMEVVKLSIAREDKEKEVSAREGRIKQLEAELLKSKEANKKMAHLREDLNAKNAQVAALKDEIEKCKGEVVRGHGQAESQRHQWEEKVAKLQKEVQAAAEDRQDAVSSLTKRLGQKEEELSQATAKLSQAEEGIDRERKLKVKAEFLIAQTKSEHEKTINSLRKELSAAREENALAAARNAKERADGQKELSSMREECERLRVALSKLSMQKRSLEEQVAGLQEGAGEARRLREKQAEESGKARSAREELAKVKRKYESALENSHKLEERLKNSYQALEEHARNQQALETRCGEAEDRARKAEEELAQSAALLDRQRRGEEATAKECLQLREKEKQLKGQLARKELECAKVKLELENVSDKLAYAREPREAAKNYAYHHDEWEDSKLASMVETQKYLDLELLNHKHALAELEGQLARAKDEVDKSARLEYEWRELERLWEAEKLRLTADNSRLAKEAKEVAKRTMEEEGKCAGLADKLEKERKNLRAWQDRCGLSEAALRKAQDESEERASEVQIREARLKALESEMALLRSEVELREGEAGKLRAVNEALEGENRRLREEVGDLTLRLREEQGASVAEGKRAREQLGRYEARVVALKREGEKFKESLRSVLVESIVGQLPRDQQESEGMARKRQGKLGLTLTNELIIRLEDYLRELSRHRLDTEQRLRATEKELVAMREDSILKTNQFQNSEAQLKAKLDELMDSLATMKQIYETREDDMRKSLQQAEWQLSISHADADKLRDALAETTKKLEGELLAANEAASRTERAFNGEVEKLRAKAKQQAERETSYSEQVASLEDYVLALEEKIVTFRSREFQLEQKFDKTTKEFEQYRLASESLSQSLNTASRQRSDLKNTVSVLESELQQARAMCERYRADAEALQREKSEGSSQIRGIMKEKEALLHQYLASEEKAFQHETRLLTVQEQLETATEQQQTALRQAEEAKDQRKRLASENKAMEGVLARKEGELKDLQEKCKERDRQVSKLTQQLASLEGSLSQMKARLEASTKSWEAKLEAAEQTAELRNKDIKAQSSRTESLAQRCESLEGQVRKAKETMQEQQLALEENSQRLAESLEANEKMEVQLFSCRSQLAQLREEVARAREELQEKDLKNYMLSSEIYKVETQAAQQATLQEQKTLDLEDAMLKYEEICEDYAAETDSLKRDKESLARQQAETQANLAKMAQELEKYGRTIRDQEAELQEMLRRCSSEAETAKRHEIQLKKARQDIKQLAWANERELRKLLQSKLRTLMECADGQGRAGEVFKALEEQAVELVRRYEAV